MDVCRVMQPQSQEAIRGEDSQIIQRDETKEEESQKNNSKQRSSVRLPSQRQQGRYS